ncbi:MAG: AAA family ATPase, partial [Chloroflexota bacterium]
MKIQRLFLRNVRNIKSLDLDFRDPVTGKPMSRIVLAGANGSGKTTILESLFGLMALTAKYAKGETGIFSRLEDATIVLSRESGLQLIFDANLGKSTPTTLSVYYGAEGSEIVHDPSV